MSESVIQERLLEAARDALTRAHAPFSKFKVGAALLTSDGRVFTGCNVENATYGLTVCAERVAIFKAVSEGAQRFSQIVIATATDELTPPCGACRQIIWEFCGDIPVILTNLHGKTEQLQMSALFPRPFDQTQLKTKE
jgi:cytidine deaminase